MRNKRLRIILTLVATFVVMFSLATNVHAEITGDSNTHVVTVPCGESVETYVDIDTWIDTTGRQESMNQYEIISNEGTSIFTGWNQPMMFQNNRSYYGRMNASTGTLGQQTLTIRFTPSGNGTPVETTLTVNCVASDDLKKVAESLGGNMPNAYTLNTDDVYTDLSKLTANQYEAILDAESAYSSLGDAEKAIADSLINEKLGMNAEDVFKAADEAIDEIANKFVDSTRLNEEGVENIEEQRKILANAVTLEDEFDSLSPRTKQRVLAKLSDNENEYSSWDEIKEKCLEMIDIIDAQLFVSNYIERIDGKINEDKIISGEDNWNSLNDNVRNIINEALEKAEGIEKNYPELLVKAKANRFLSDNLTTSDGKIIVEANNSNYQQIIDAKDDYEALSEEVKEEVNKILTELGNTTYPQLLQYAQLLETTPKTGDVIIYVAIGFIVSALGIGITFIRKKR